MKKHLNFLKGVSLAGLAVAAISGTCLTLTSCGSGGGDVAETDAQRAAEYMENKSLELHMNSVCCYVNMSERLRGSSILDAQIRYGSGAPVQGNLIVVSATMNGDDPASFRLKVTTNTGSISSETDFKTWWGVTQSNGNLVFNGDTFVDALVTSVISNGLRGDFTANTVTIKKDDNGNDVEEEKILPGAFFTISQ